ncbi:RNA polymerase sigma factor [Hyunsoonleella sp. SJ7]|uniref:RNA polymerase sigma factor n=1 Tax=Hyunsoonleella aquatilis TaxID=2762758 RepID=A0A923H8X1_9FLAO|nr:RNA polymerase sigma factor [Hyunsoonleella aquatilis]MBC3758770.1 RNA polymerase sigma factor [Hyunsoonleella aquatilis]
MTPNHQNIEKLIALCIEGNQSAQMEVYNRYYKAMYNTSIRIVKNSFEAEDIMQDSFLTAFTKLGSLKDTKTFGPWLKRIVVNNSIYHYRKRIKHQETALEDVLYKIEDESDGIESEQTYQNAKAQQVLTAMKGLKDNYRIALTLSLIEGYDNEEISEIMKINHGNCRTLISRAKDSLRKRLNEALVN